MFILITYSNDNYFSSVVLNKTLTLHSSAYFYFLNVTSKKCKVIRVACTVFLLEGASVAQPALSSVSYIQLSPS